MNLPPSPGNMEEEHQRRIDDGGGAERSNHDQNGASAGAQQQQSKQAGDEPAISTLCSKRKITDIYDESRLDGFVDDASAMQDAIKDVLDKASSPETSKKVFLRSQLQHLNKELVGIAEATYLDMLSKVLMQSPEILDAVFQTDRSNKILESLAEKVHKQLPDDVVEAEQQAACLDAVVDVHTELGDKTTKLTQMMVEYMIDTSRKERRVSERPRVVQDPSLPVRSHGRSRP